MKNNIFLLLLLIPITNCSGGKEKSTPKSTKVEISTPYGTIKVLLYDETKEHKANFIRLVSSGSYDGLLFHRVIKDFMIQGGDPQSRNAAPSILLGNGDQSYTLPAEIFPQFYHKRGALAAARQGDEVNPEQRSSGSQFYIVDGKQFTDAELDQIQKRIQQMRMQNLYLRIFINEREKVRKTGAEPNLSLISAMAADSIERISAKLTPFSFTTEQRTTYKTSGGAPHLDGSYTVFGEVIEGLDVIDKIASLPVDKNNRPLQNVPMKIKLISVCP